jgi:hypothetical protein
MNFADWKADILARAPVTQYPDPQPLPHDLRYTSDDAKWSRAMRIVMPAPFGSLAR